MDRFSSQSMSSDGLQTIESSSSDNRYVMSSKMKVRMANALISAARHFSELFTIFSCRRSFSETLAICFTKID